MLVTAESKPMWRPQFEAVTDTRTVKRGNQCIEESYKIGSKPVLGKDGEQQWQKTGQVRGVITFETGTFRLVFSATRRGQSIGWTMSQWKDEPEMTTKVIDGELVDVPGESRWVKKATKSISLDILVQELLRLTGDDAEQSIELVKTALVGV
jgi:hypothetical protein